MLWRMAAQQLILYIKIKRRSGKEGYMKSFGGRLRELEETKRGNNLGLDKKAK